MEGRTDLYHAGLPLNNSYPYTGLYNVQKIQTFCVTEMAVGPVYGPVGLGL